MISEDLQKKFLEAYEAHSDGIFRHCYFRLSNRERAQELTQETFMRAWQTLKEGAEVQSIKAFLYRIAHNLVIDEYRKKKEVSLEMLQESGFDPSINDTKELVEHAIEKEKFLKALERLDEDERHLIVMRYIDDLGPSEIASLTGERQNVISVRLNRAVKKLESFI